MLRAVDLVEPTMSGDFGELMEWADEIRTHGVRANTDTPVGAKRAREFGAAGIGLCRTEHMFFEEDRLIAMREMILASDEEGRREALAKLLPMQKQDFIEIFEAMEGLPVIIRTLDPPLHEFLPHTAEEVDALAREINVHPANLQAKIDSLHEANPMLGHRGCRLGVAYPEITEMQARAIIEAAVEVTRRGKKVIPEIMIPLTIDPHELSVLVEHTRAVADAVLKEHAASEPKGRGRRAKINYLVGTMVETPRAALLAGPMAEVAQFFSFGTNDLTQLTMGLSRDDAGRFLPDYLSSEPGGSARADLPVESKTPILPHDPFQSLDVDGVGMLVEMAVNNGRAARPELKLGICGEHGGDPASIGFCEQIGLDYVSCSPFRVPIARLAAAQAAIDAGRARHANPRRAYSARRETRPRIVSGSARPTSWPGAQAICVKASTKPRSEVRPSKAKAQTTGLTKAARGKPAQKKSRKRARA